jgi:hypothetical protein
VTKVVGVFVRSLRRFIAFPLPSTNIGVRIVYIVTCLSLICFLHSSLAPLLSPSIFIVHLRIASGSSIITQLFKRFASPVASAALKVREELYGCSLFPSIVWC